MKCPNCAKEIHFEPRSASAFAYAERSGNSTGFDVATGFCPACSELIVLFREGDLREGYNGNEFLAEIRTQEVIYPKFATIKDLPSEVIEPWRSRFREAAILLMISPNASAALSRRTLQQLLRDHFKVKPSSLADEIDEFLGRLGLPSYLASAVDGIRSLGNFAAHPIKNKHTGEIVEVEPGEAEWLISTIESLFDFAFVQPARLKSIKEQVNAKLEAAGKPKMKEQAS